jgi:hypothetical protein
VLPIGQRILRYCSPVIRSIDLQRSTIMVEIWRIAAIVALSLTTIGGARAAEVPPAMEPISGINTPTAQGTGTKDVLALNTSVFELYDKSLHIFEHNILAKHPVILGLFSGRAIVLWPKFGLNPFLPPEVPFGSHQWPTFITPGPGPASLAQLQH